MNIDWSTKDPEKQGWYLIKRKDMLPAMAFWFSKNHWSLCGENGRCMPKEVIGWVEIE